MGVIALPNIGPQGPGAGITWELRSNTARFPSLSGYTRTLERGGAHFAANLRYENLNTSKAARMRAFLSACRGQAQRFYLRDFGYTKRGSFAAPELSLPLTSTAGWNPQVSAGSAPTLSVVDNGIRATLTGYATNLYFYTGVGLTQYAPYCARGLALHGRGTLQDYGVFLDGGGGVSVGQGTAPGLNNAVLVAGGTTGTFVPAFWNLVQSGQAGDYFDVGYASVARCALVDNGPNMVLRSDEFDNAAWGKVELTVSANADDSPDGTVTADRLTPSTNNGDHYLSQGVTVPSSPTDVAWSGAFKGNGYNFVRLHLAEATGGTILYQVFNLTTGAVGASSGIGANWANLRAFITPLGGQWYHCSIVARKTNAATSISAYVVVQNADSVAVYAGNGSSGIRAWRATFAQSSVPTRLRQTTSAATAGTSQTGSGLYLKGLPASTNGLLVADDLAEIITPSGSQAVRTTKSLDSNAAQLGYWEFETPLRESPGDNAGIVICNPLMRAMLDDRTVRWTQRHAGFVDLEFTAVEDMTA